MTALSFLLQTRPELPLLTHGSGPQRPAAPLCALRTPYLLSTVVLVVGVVLTAGPVGHKKAAVERAGPISSGGSRTYQQWRQPDLPAVEAAGPISSGPRRGRRADRPGADRSDVKSALMTSRAGCATAGAAAMAGILAVRDGSPGPVIIAAIAKPCGSWCSCKNRGNSL